MSALTEQSVSVNYKLWLGLINFMTSVFLYHHCFYACTEI